MFTARLMVVIQPPIDAAGARTMIQRAKTNAVRAAGLRFAVPDTLYDDWQEEDGTLFYDTAAGLEGLLPMLTDETHFVCMCGEHAFAKRWDASLHTTLRPLGARALLTGSISACALPHSSPASLKDAPTIRMSSGESLAALRLALQKQRGSSSVRTDGNAFEANTSPAVPSSEAEVCLPALKEVFENESVLIGRGIPLVCADRPVKTLVIDPAFLYGPVSFLREAELSQDTLSLAAYLTGFSVYALPSPCLWPVLEPPARLLQLPSADALPGTALARFEQLLGFRRGERRVEPKAAMGLFTHEDSYVQHLPNGLIWSQQARSVRMRLTETHMPLMVSAFIDLPDARVLPHFYTLRFGFLKRVESLPLLLYTGGSQERALRASFPNTQSYPDGTLLPRHLLESGMTPSQRFTRSKLLLMLRAAQRRVEFSHSAWVDMDILPHPICAEAVPDFRSLMDDRIHLATVNGIPDASFVVVPEKLLEPLCKLAVSITQLDAELERGFEEALLWERLFQKKPEWFAIHRMPKRRLLFLSVFDRELLAPSIRSLLNDLPEPYYASEADEKESAPV